MNTLVTSQTHAPETAARTGRYVRAGLVAGVTAAVANLAIVATARAFDVPMRVQDKAIPLVAFPQLTLIASIIAVGLAAAVTRWCRNPHKVFVTTTVALTALFTVPPVLADATTSTKLVLELTHLVVAACVIPTVARRLPNAR
jgi:hypothetical protein